MRAIGQDSPWLRTSGPGLEQAVAASWGDAGADALAMLDGLGWRDAWGAVMLPGLAVGDGDVPRVLTAAIVRAGGVPGELLEARALFGRVAAFLSGPRARQDTDPVAPVRGRGWDPAARLMLITLLVTHGRRAAK